MPRAGDVYSLPPNSLATTGQPINSVRYNAFLNDIAAEQNAVRPITAGGTGAASAAQARTNLGIDPLIAAAVPPGVMVSFAGVTAPSGWLLCAGQEVPVSTYGALAAVCGIIYGPLTNGSGAAGTTHFRLPDHRGRVEAGKDDMGGTSANRLTGVAGSLNGDTLGAVGGTETHVLTQAELPNVNLAGTTNVTGAHTHSYNKPFGNSGSDSSSGGFHDDQSNATGSNGDHSHTVSTPLGGSATPLGIVQPTIVSNKIIKT